MNQSVDLGGVLTAVEDAGLFVSLCTIQSPSQAPDALGQADLTNWTDVSGMVGIACMASPLTINRPSTSDEIQANSYTAEMDTFHVLLDGFYPTIRQRYRAVISGGPFDVATALDIMGAESDSQGIMTRLACRRYSL